MRAPPSLALLTALLLSCAGSPEPAAGDTADAADGWDGGDGADGTDPAAAVSASVEADPSHPLLAWVTVSTEAAGEARIVATADGAPTRATPAFLVGPEAVTVPVLGLRPETAYALRVEVTGDGGDGAADLAFTPGSLPADLPPVTVQLLDPDRVEDGLVMLPLSRWENGPVAGWGYVVALDEGGALCWYIETAISGTFTRLDDGGILLTELTDTAVQLDPLGRTERSLTVTDFGIETVHHELVLVPGEGQTDTSVDPHLLLLSSELQVIDGYDDGSGGTVAHNVVGDVVVETDWDGNLHAEIGLFDLLDPLRTTPDFDLPFWQIPPYDEVDTPKDWTHANAIVPMDDGTWMVSLRNQDWLVGLDPESGALTWRMGAEGDFELLSGRWFSTQHSPRLLGDGDRLLMYDNGANRPEEGFPNSRVVEYAVDWEARTVEQLWEYRGAVPYYVPAAGDVDPLPGGNLLVTDGGVVDAVRTIGGFLIPHLTPRIVELAGEGDDREPVLQVILGTWGDWESPAYIAYRADKVPDLYGSRGVRALAR